MIAVIPVRGGVLPAGAEETLAEAGGRGVVIGEDAASAAATLSGEGISACEAGPYRPGAWAAALVEVLSGEPAVILPASPDGRDLAPRLAAALGRPLLAPAIEVAPHRVVLVRAQGQICEEVTVDEPFVATLVPGVRGVEATAGAGAAEPGQAQTTPLAFAAPGAVADAEVVEVLPPDPDTVDLVEAPRIVGAGAGLGGADVMALLAAVARAVGASVGATRVVTDAGWLPPERQIGTTGVAVNPRLYVALGVSGAVQHTSGLGQPDHIVSVNLDPSCPMTTMADLGIVADARAFLAEVAARLGVTLNV